MGIISSAYAALAIALTAAIVWLIDWIKSEAQQQAASAAEKQIIDERLKVITNNVSQMEKDKDAYVEKVTEFLTSTVTDSTANTSPASGDSGPTKPKL